MPPRQAMTADSVKSWRTILRRLAPSANRVAISCRRAAERISSRFETFAQAISSTNPTAPMKINKGVRTSPTMAVLSGIRRELHSPGLPSCDRPLTNVSHSAWACCGVFPDFNRPITGRENVKCGSLRISRGRQISAWPGYEKPGGKMPITVWATPLRATVRPTSVASDRGASR